MEPVLDPTANYCLDACQSIRRIENASDPGFEAAARLALRLLNAPIALVSIVDEAQDRQFFKASIGLPEPWRTEGQTPLSHSFCQYVKQRNAPLVVSDARLHPLLQNNGAIADLGVIAYLGVPVAAEKGAPLGALCVIDNCPRSWSIQDVDLLSDLALGVSDALGAAVKSA